MKEKPNIFQIRAIFNRNLNQITAPPPPPQPKKQKIVVKEEPKSFKVKIPPKREEPIPVKKEVKIYLESFYYGIYETGTDNDSGVAVKFEANVSQNLDFMDLMKKTKNEHSKIFFFPF